MLLDALNIAYWRGNPPSLRLPLSLMAGLLEQQRPARLCFDASARHRLGDEAGIYEQLGRYPRYVSEVPSGRRADGELLRQARANAACIVSRDRFRDYRSRYRKLIDDPTRLFGGHVQEGRLQVPALEFSCPLHASAQQAWDALRPLLAPD